jgi:hypothetical protein
MPNLGFRVDRAEAVPFAAAPLIALKLRIDNVDAEQTIHTIVLRCQIQIEVTRRTYSATEQGAMQDLFGEPSRWGQTLRSMLWTHASVVVPSFTGSTTADLHVPCTFDFNVAATKYFDGLEEGEIPLNLLFSGNVFYADATGALRVAPISWDKEAKFRLPLSVWKDMMARYYPNTAWLCLRKDVFDQLYRYKVERGMPTWEEAIESALALRETAAIP